MSIAILIFTLKFIYFKHNREDKGFYVQTCFSFFHLMLSSFFHVFIPNQRKKNKLFLFFIFYNVGCFEKLQSFCFQTLSLHSFLINWPLKTQTQISPYMGNPSHTHLGKGPFLVLLQHPGSPSIIELATLQYNLLMRRLLLIICMLRTRTAFSLIL